MDTKYFQTSWKNIDDILIIKITWLWYKAVTPFQEGLWLSSFGTRVGSKHHLLTQQTPPINTFLAIDPILYPLKKQESF